MYYIYHIPTYKRKNGKIGKIGCTEEVDAKVRVEKQGYTDYEILETHTDIIIASNREMQLQKQYGYPVDTLPYYKSRSKWGSVAGKIQGKKNVESGHLAKISSFGGKIGGKTHVESGRLATLHQKNKIPVLQYRKDNQFIKEWESASDAGTELRINNSCITQCCKGRQKSAGGYKWKYKK